MVPNVFTSECSMYIHSFAMFAKVCLKTIAFHVAYYRNLFFIHILLTAKYT